MRTMNRRALSLSIRPFVVGGLIFLGACQTRYTASGSDPKTPPASDPPQNSNTGYALDPNTNAATIKFKTKRETSGIVSFDQSVVDTATININTTENETTVPAIKVTAIVSFPNSPGLGGQYTVVPETKPIKNTGKVFKVDITQFTQDLVKDIFATQPPAFDPKKDLSSFTPVKVKLQITTVLNSEPVPAAATKVSGADPKDVEGHLTLTLQQVIGELSAGK